MRTLTPRQKTLLFLDLCPLSPAQKRKLMSVFREPGEILQKTAAGSPRLLALVGQNLYTEMQRRCNAAFFWAAVRRYEQEGVDFVCLGDPDYPPALLSLPDPPPVLYLAGDRALLGLPKISVVGSRKCSLSDYRRIKETAAALAEGGFCVVSGLAEGCDAAAHAGALEAGGRTLAVTANGFESVYPKSNADLFRRIRGEGLLVCENPPDFRPKGFHFVLRNRIVAALSGAVVVVMAGAKSGTLSTARFALDCKRQVFARSAEGPDFAGCRALIAESGCIGVSETSDLLEKLAALPPPASLLGEEEAFPSPGPLKGGEKGVKGEKDLPGSWEGREGAPRKKKVRSPREASQSKEKPGRSASSGTAGPSGEPSSGRGPEERKVPSSRKEPPHARQGRSAPAGAVPLKSGPPETDTRQKERPALQAAAGAERAGLSAPPSPARKDGPEGSDPRAFRHQTLYQAPPLFPDPPPQAGQAFENRPSAVGGSSPPRLFRGKLRIRPGSAPLKSGPEPDTQAEKPALQAAAGSERTGLSAPSSPVREDGPELPAEDRAGEPLRRRLLAALGREGRRADELLAEFDRAELFDALFDLEFEGLIVRQGGLYFLAGQARNSAKRNSGRT